LRGNVLNTVKKKLSILKLPQEKTELVVIHILIKKDASYQFKTKWCPFAAYFYGI